MRLQVGQHHQPRPEEREHDGDQQDALGRPAELVAHDHRDRRFAAADLGDVADRDGERDQEDQPQHGCRRHRGHDGARDGAEGVLGLLREVSSRVEADKRG